MSKRRIKLNEHTLNIILSVVMWSPSVVKHLRGGKVYTYTSLWCLDLNDTRIFSRRKVLRLIRRYKKDLRRLSD